MRPSRQQNIAEIGRDRDVGGHVAPRRSVGLENQPRIEDHEDGERDASQDRQGYPAFEGREGAPYLHQIDKASNV